MEEPDLRGNKKNQIERNKLWINHRVLEWAGRESSSHLGYQLPQLL
jgi:hypothetical protein